MRPVVSFVARMMLPVASETELNRGQTHPSSSAGCVGIASSSEGSSSGVGAAWALRVGGGVVGGVVLGGGAPTVGGVVLGDGVFGGAPSAPPGKLNR